MRGVVGLLSLCVVLAILRAALIALMIMLLLALVYSFIRRPLETLGLLGTLALSALAVAYPLAFIGGVVVVTLACTGLGRWRRGHRSRSLLPTKSSAP